MEGKDKEGKIARKRRRLNVKEKEQANEMHKGTEEVSNKGTWRKQRKKVDKTEHKEINHRE